ncbi:response regulator [Carboxylicivirga caseinilyticus]|uniref:response regulator n=1 Tax=Carboxylicivirga caseinilyticus TaxID=3417572 RepID=UPI003D34AB6C|nr:response regulator [Marinilabiliaceae bacterium A049]
MQKLQNPLSVLLVEDNVLNQKLIFLNLSKYGFIIDIANNGQEALDKLEVNTYDLILMDLMMPIMDGLETTVAIRDQEKITKKHMPIIGLTANTYDADRDKCLAYGMDEYMAKPFDLKEFFTNITNLGLIK